MRREITPTSPLIKKENKKTKSLAQDRWPFFSVVLAIAFGFLAGFLGHLISRSYPYTWPYAREIVDNAYLTKSQDDEVLMIKDNSQSDHPVLVEQVLEENRAALVSIYQGAQRLGTGLILTNDGWVLTLNTVVPQDKISLLTKDKKNYLPEKILRDSYSGFAFIKIDAQNLPVVEFADLEGIKLGSELLLYYFSPIQKDNLQLVYLANLNYYQDLLRSTEKYSHYYLIDKTVGADYLASPLFDLNGKIVGVYLSENKVMPSLMINNLLSKIIKQGRITYPDFGISYYDLSQNFCGDEVCLISPAEQEKGALVHQLNSDLDLDLEVNDIILKVADQEIDSDHDLSQVLHQYSSSETVRMTILRQGKEIEVEIIL